MFHKTDSLLFLDGGDPQESAKVKKLLGYLDGQTTNPSLISKNPQIKERITSGNKFSPDELISEYKKIVIEAARSTSGPISVEVYADSGTKAPEMINQARQFSEWADNAYIKLPITLEGLKAAKVLCHEIKLNMTLCFSQEQAAAVYSATLGAGFPLFVSPFVGRLDDIKVNGMDLVANILSMYEAGDKHVQVLTASVRNVNHLLYALQLKSPAVTVPYKVIREWAKKDFPIPTSGFVYDVPQLSEISYRQIPLDLDLNEYNISHPLTDKGIEMFCSDWNNLLQ